MIAFIKILALIVIVHVLIRAFMDVSEEDDIYDYCYGCQCGLCMEEPKSERCERWVNENKDHESADNKGPDIRG